MFVSFALVACTLCVCGSSLALPNKQTFSHEEVSYAVLNHTVQPVSEGCAVTKISELTGAIANCSDIHVGSFIVPAANQPLILKLNQGTKITFTGEIQFDKNPVNGYMLQIWGDNVTVIGSSTHLFHGHGELYWDGRGGAGSTKPTFCYLRGHNSTYTGLSFKNCPHRCVTIDSSTNVTVSGFLIDNRDGAPGTAPKGREGHNTDGFDVAKTQFLNLSNHIVYNQDDCVAINSGANMIIEHFTCDGSHGFDIATGMSTTDQTQNVVNNVTFQHSKLTNGMYGLHILGVNDAGKGSVSNIHYNNITFDGPSDYGIMIQQDFSDKTQGSTDNPVGNVPISDIDFKHVTGIMNGNFSRSLSVRCAENACSGITFENVTITSNKFPNECMNITIEGWC